MLLTSSYAKVKVGTKVPTINVADINRDRLYSIQYMTVTKLITISTHTCAKLCHKLNKNNLKSF